MIAELPFCVCLWRNIFLHRREELMLANLWIRKRTPESLDWKREKKSILVDMHPHTKGRKSSFTQSCGQVIEPNFKFSVYESNQLRYASLRPKIGLLVIHFPLVKSGNETGELPVAMEASDKGEMAIQAAAS